MMLVLWITVTLLFALSAVVSLTLLLSRDRDQELQRWIASMKDLPIDGESP